MTDNLPAIQTVVLDDARTTAVFVEVEGREARVFYDLDALLSQYIPAHVANTMRATTNNDESLRMRALGENDVLMSIADSTIDLRDAYELSNSLRNATPSDFL